MSLSIAPSHQIEDLLLVAQNYFTQGKELIGGLICSSIFEIYLNQAKKEKGILASNSEYLLTELREHKYITFDESEKLRKTDIRAPVSREIFSAASFSFSFPQRITIGLPPGSFSFSRLTI